MDSASHQKILGYFIEEAKEHLETLEKGLLDLRAVVGDSERVNEMFRAAHSVKGGAAMLGYGSIQKTAHRLEDSFKILKEQPVPVDQKLETLFLKALDTLSELLERLQGPFGLREEEAQKTLEDSEPTFIELQNYLNKLAGVPQAKAEARKPAIPANFVPQATGGLKQMLQLFKQAESPESRKKLLNLCSLLIKLGAGLEPWQTLIQTVQKAIANPKNPYAKLAPVIIKDVKQAIDLAQAGKVDAIAPSPTLQQFLAPAPEPATPATPATPAAPKELTIPAEPRAAVKALMQTFNKKQLIEIMQLLQRVTATK